jgi:DNA repair protein RadA/Sms
MARSASQYHCQSCGAVSPKWAGKCDACGGWNTLVEERIEQVPGQTKRKTSKTVEFKLLSAANAEGACKRHLTNIEEFDRVTGGGLVPGSAVLIGGDPGIGKSTLLLQLVCELGLAGQKTAYITGEESVEQVRMRALRLGLQNAEAGLAAATNAADIAEIWIYWSSIPFKPCLSPALTVPQEQ